MASPLLIALLLLFPLLFFLFKRKRNAKNEPPGPRGLPIIGNLHQLGALPHQSLWQYSEKYGPLMLIKFGSVPALVVSSSEIAKEIFKNHDLKCSNRPPSKGTAKLSYNYRDITFSPYGDYWRDMRKLCALELFSAKRVFSFRSVREEEVSLIMDSISKSASSSSPVDLSEKNMSLTANVTCRIAFGKSVLERGFRQERFQEVVEEAMAMLGSFAASDFFPYVGWIIDRITGLHGRIERNSEELDSFYQKIIDEHIQNKRKDEDDQHEDVVDILLQMERSQSDSGSSFHFSRDNIKALLMDLFLAGVDTSAITLTWAMSELIRNPKVMKKVQAEIRNCVGNKEKVSETDIEKLEYMKMVLKEILRLHPPATLLLPRETMSHFRIKEYDVYPRTQIHVNAWALGRDPKIWKNPEKFYPERFMDNFTDYKVENYEMLPFGAGRRICPAGAMGMALVELALANLLFCFDWKLPHDMKLEDFSMEESFGIVIRKKVPLLLVPTVYHHAL